MGSSDKAQNSGLCQNCIETRTRFCNSCPEKNSTLPKSSQTSCLQCHVTRCDSNLKNTPSVRWQLFLHFSLWIMLLLRPGLAEASCSTGEPFKGFLPSVPQSQLKAQYTTSAGDCAETCCLKTYCDLAWIVDDDCFHARCATESDCIPLLGASDSSLVYIMDRSTHPYSADSGTECNPLDKWDTCPIGEHCDASSYHCECDSGTMRNPVTSRCELEERDPWDTADSSNALGNHKQSESYDPDTQDDRQDSHDSNGASNDQAKWDKFRFCESEEDCEPLEYCFGLQRFGEGLCKCGEGYHRSDRLDACVSDFLKGDSVIPSSVSLSTEPAPTTGSVNSPTTPPNTPPVTLPETPLDEPSDTGGITDEVSNIPGLNSQISKGAGNNTEDVEGEGGGGGAEGGAEEVKGSEVQMPQEKNGGQGTVHQGDQEESENKIQSNPQDAGVPPSPKPDTQTEGGDTETETEVDALTEKTLNTDGKPKTSSPTSPSPTPVTPALTKLTVSAGGDKTLQLPGQDGTTLIAYVIPQRPPKGSEYSYDWQVLDRPEDSGQAEMVGEHAKRLQLAKLSAGVYRFKVEVRGEGSYGSATVNVTVLPPPRVNMPPKAVIEPPSQEVILPNPDTYLDGSNSNDDDKIVSYQWEEVEGPVRETKITGDTSTLKLTDLVPGHYVIRLTVTDSDGVSDSALANVTVKEEIDNPPVAKAGKDVIIKLPINSAVLYGNSSFDDHPGLVYEWFKVSGPVADMSGSSSAILHLDNLEEGTYIFRLTVTDSKGRKDSDEATVIVKPENNLPPTANAGPDKELSLPDDSTTLDGSGSVDDLGVTSYLWEKDSGPNDPEIKDADKDVATVSGLVEGRYIFKLTVGDKQGATNSDTVDVVVKKETNTPPTANAGPDITIRLPNNVVELDGSESTDDKGIVSYQWKRDPKSPAAGSVVGKSDHEPVLKLTGLVAGTYHMILNVTDAKGAYNTDTAVVTVQKDPHRLNLVEITFDVDASRFTEQDKIDMARSLAVLLSVRDEDISIQQVFQTPNEQLQVIFFATNSTSRTAIPGSSVVKTLVKKKLPSDTDLLKFRVLEVDTMICQNNCSGHGSCDPYTRLCVCESFWMENYFRRWLGDKESNCDWSILYVIIVACVVVIGLGGVCWLCICCIKRSRRKVKRRRRYNLLSQDLDGQETMEMLPKNANGKQSSSIMISESDDDTDEETTLFDSKKRQGKNGKANGSVMTVQPRKKRPFPLISSSNRTEKL